MAEESSTIIQFAKTGIILDELAVPNRTGNTGEPSMYLQDADDKEFGSFRPVVFLNGYFVDKYLLDFEIDLNGILPTIYFRFYTGRSTFISINYPKDGDIVSVYIRSNVEVYAPLRMDFNILSVDSDLSEDSSGNMIYFDIIGECRVPKFYAEVCKAFRDKTSYETLFEVSQDLSLGFCTNDPNLNDRMTWICPNLSYYNFIKEVTKSSYKDDRSFYSVWVDIYYNLNFVNLNNQIESVNPMQDAKSVSNSAEGAAVDGILPGIDLLPSDIPMHFSNHPDLTGYPLYIYRYSLLSEAGNTSNVMGYIQKVQFYDETGSGETPSAKNISYDLQAITTDQVAENMVLQRGRVNESLYLEEIKKRWMGILNTGNQQGVHPNYLHARVQNPLNISDLTKFTLQIEIRSYYSGFYKGQAVPVQVYVKERGERMENSGISNDQKAQSEELLVLDQFLSGYYVIMGYEIKWSEAKGFHQVVNLSKREWFINSAGNKPRNFPINIFSNPTGSKNSSTKKA